MTCYFFKYALHPFNFEIEDVSIVLIKLEESLKDIMVLGENLKEIRDSL
jgi:hypothetical protein